MTGMRQVGVPRVLRVGPGALPEVPRLVVDGGFELARTCVVTGAGPSHPHGAAVADGLRAAGVKVELRTATEGTLDEAARLASQV
ncbi:MAG: hypothetical protein QOE05_2086, partial [Actinomycetota bacterium]|nr:hypothetical protein [Actinomycetota bacterium]